MKLIPYWYHIDQLLDIAPILEELSMVFSSHDMVFWYEQAKALLHQRVDSKLRLIKTVRVSRGLQKIV